MLNLYLFNKIPLQVQGEIFGFSTKDKNTTETALLTNGGVCQQSCQDCQTTMEAVVSQPELMETRSLNPSHE